MDHFGSPFRTRSGFAASDATEEGCGADGKGNSLDEDCDGLTDEGCDQSDLDGDGYALTTDSTTNDCDPWDSSVHPNAAEVCCLLDDAERAIADQTSCSVDVPCPAPDLMACVLVSGADESACLPKRCDSNCEERTRRFGYSWYGPRLSLRYSGSGWASFGLGASVPWRLLFQ